MQENKRLRLVLEVLFILAVLFPIGFPKLSQLSAIISGTTMEQYEAN